MRGRAPATVAALAVAAGALGGGAAPLGAATPTPVNPERSPVVAEAAVPTGQSVRLRVRDVRGRVVALGRPVVARDGAVALTWPGTTTAGVRVGDGRYRLSAQVVGGRAVATAPAEVVIDRTAPRLRAVAPTPRIPARPGPFRLSVAAHDRAWTADAVRPEVRLVVDALAGGRIVAGGWHRAGAPVPLPERLVRSGRAGAVRITVEGRDAAGNRSTPVRLVVALPGPAGPARVIRRVATRKPWVALTIDDGYRADVVRRMADFAHNTQTPLTMCLNGGAAEGFSSSVRGALTRAVAGGWVQACSHGRSHNTGTGTGHATAVADLTGAIGWDRAAGQSTLPFYRPPYGALGPGILSAAGQLGYRDVLLWSIDTNDWRGRSAAAIASQVVSESRRGSIVLMHALPQTMEALPRIVAGLSARGLTPVLIGDLLAAGRPTA